MVSHLDRRFFIEAACDRFGDVSSDVDGSPPGFAATTLQSPEKQQKHTEGKLNKNSTTGVLEEIQMQFKISSRQFFCSFSIPTPSIPTYVAEGHLPQSQEGFHRRRYFLVHRITEAPGQLRQRIYDPDGPIYSVAFQDGIQVVEDIVAEEFSRLLRRIRSPSGPFVFIGFQEDIHVDDLFAEVTKSPPSIDQESRYLRSSPRSPRA